MGTIEQHAQLEVKYHTKCEMWSSRNEYDSKRRRTDTYQFNRSKHDASWQYQSSSHRWVRIQQIEVIYVTDTLVAYKQISCIRFCIQSVNWQVCIFSAQEMLIRNYFYATAFNLLSQTSNFRQRLCSSIDTPNGAFFCIFVKKQLDVYKIFLQCLLWMMYSINESVKY